MTQSGGMYMDAPADGRERKMALVMVRSFFSMPKRTEPVSERAMTSS